MSKWAQEKEARLPSRRTVWSDGSFFVAVAVFVGIFVWQVRYEWTALQRYYWPTYANTWWHPDIPAWNYELLYVVDREGRVRLAQDDEIAMAKREPDGSTTYRLTRFALEQGWVKAELEPGFITVPKATGDALHDTLKRGIYLNLSAKELVRKPGYWAVGTWVVLFSFGLWMDGKRAHRRKGGQYVRGAEMASVAEFNRQYGSDGIGWRNRDQTWLDKVRQNKVTQWMRIPRQLESYHLLVMGDTGTGKSAALREILLQISERDSERVILYDPALEYLPELWSPERGDVVLNPVDARCPFWNLADEVLHPAEALTVSKSLFPEESRENDFFEKWSREIFAYLLNLKPTLEQLVHWLCHPEEIDRIVAGTEMESVINPQSANQRNGVLGSLNRVAGALKLLPRQQETNSRWSAAEWAKQGKGWVFITSKPTFREQLRPLISLWLDLLVLRLMNDGAGSTPKTWFVLDEVASLQRLPQLHTALTENRKSEHPVVLSLQGRSQMDKRYGVDAEAMMSQPSTKMFFRTTEPNAAKWISEALGDQEREYIRETTTQGQSAQSRNSVSEQSEVRVKRLVMAAQIMGLPSLHGYMKLGNLVVPIHFPYLNLEKRHEPYIERKVSVSMPVQALPPEKVPDSVPIAEIEGEAREPFFE